jgi:hypothetical protein
MTQNLHRIVPGFRISWGIGQPDPPWPLFVSVLILACLGSTQRRVRPLFGLCLAVAAPNSWLENTRRASSPSLR